MNRERAIRESYRLDAPSTAIISISDSNKNKPCFNKSQWLRTILFLQFDDVEKGENNCITSNDVKKIVEFVKRNKLINNVERMIVHCEAGISRSAGVAAAIMKFLNGDDMPIFNNGKYTPNMTCYRMVLNALMGCVDESVVQSKEQININAWKSINEI